MNDAVTVVYDDNLPFTFPDCHFHEVIHEGRVFHLSNKTKDGAFDTYIPLTHRVKRITIKISIGDARHGDEKQVQ